MSAMENMVRTILRALDIDVPAMQKEVVSRVEAFEANVKTLNETLISLHQRQQRMEAKLDALFKHLRIPTANEEISDDRKQLPHARDANANRDASSAGS